MQEPGTGQDAAGDGTDRQGHQHRVRNGTGTGPQRNWPPEGSCGGLFAVQELISRVPAVPKGSLARDAHGGGSAALPAPAATGMRWKTMGKGSGERGRRAGNTRPGWGEGTRQQGGIARSQSDNSWYLVRARGISGHCQESSSNANQSLCAEHARGTPCPREGG